MSSAHPPDQDQDSDELARFREAWKEELRLRKPGQPTTSRSDQTAISTSAVEVYSKAVSLEQDGQFDGALSLYRQAFRMDPVVDRAYHLQEKAAALAQPPDPQPIRVLNRTPEDAVLANGLSHQMLALSISAKDHVPGSACPVVTGDLDNVLKNFPTDLTFERENEKEGLPLQTLPNELLFLILRMLDHTSIERFAAVSRKARLVSLDNTIWREIVQATYVPPQVPDTAFLTELVGHYMFNFRQLYVEHPRVRTDGVYIAFCHYIRQGLSENSWVNITHHVTYYRYLRFYPNGQVLSLLTNEDHSPPSIIPLLKPNLQMKGLFIGTWSLSGTAVYIQNLTDMSNRLACHTASSPTNAPFSLRYSYQMILEIRSRPVGRWNRLQIICYDSVELGTGEVVPIALKHERPLWFSKVRSYTT